MRYVNQHDALISPKLSIVKKSMLDLLCNSPTRKTRLDDFRRKKSARTIAQTIDKEFKMRL